MTRLLFRYVFREILTSSLLGTVLATFVVFLQKVDNLFAVLVASNPDPWTIARLFALTMPSALPLTVPFGVLVGILIGLGRMATDGEIVAMRAAGVSSRKAIGPVLLFASIGAAVAAYTSLRLTPYSTRAGTELVNRLIASQVSGQIRERIFDENFPNTILYVGDVRPGEVSVWRPMFIANVGAPEQRSDGTAVQTDGPAITVAASVLATSDPASNRIQLELHNFSSHQMGKDGTARDESGPTKTIALYAEPPKQKPLASSAMNTRQLLRYEGPDRIEAAVELHKRFAWPLACLALALIGIPLGVATRKGGRSAGYVNGMLLAFFGYYLSSVSLINVAKQGSLPVAVAIWLPNVVFGVAGIIFLSRMERPGDRDLLGRFGSAIGSMFEKVRSTAEPGDRPRMRGWRMASLPQVVDMYVLSSFLFYLAVTLAAFVSMTEVYNFFELTGDMIKNSSLVTMFRYLFFLTPHLIYKILPISLLVAVLVTLGVLSKQNEVTAFKACGVSVYRLAAPILIASTLFSGALFGFNYTYVPAANRRQDALRNEIKGKPKQTYLSTSTWIMGNDSRIYYYKYLDPLQQAMVGVSVFELDPATFALKRQIQAQRAYWSPSLNAWVFENGWSSSFRQNRRITPRNDFLATSFRELNETPEYFLREAVKEQQMNFLELQQYIVDLQQTGLVDTRKLQVQYHLKFANPLFALIMAMIAVPFGFLTGTRGAMTGIGVSLVIAIAYLGIQPLFEKIGDAGLLPPAMAAWSPDVLFGLAGVYLLLRMRS